MARALPAAAAAAPVPVQQRKDPAVRQRLTAPALRAFFNIAAAWQLSAAEQRALLGWPAAASFQKYKNGTAGTLSFDTLTRISLVLGIYKGLHILYPEARLADGWVKLPNSNPVFRGKPAMELMAEGGIDGLLQVRRLLDGRRG